MQEYKSPENYRQPSFFDIESARERLETQLRAERFPVTMADMARRAEDMHKVFQRDNTKQLEPWEREDLYLELLMRTPEERKDILAKFGSTRGKEFNFSDYMQTFYEDTNSWGYGHNASKTNLVAHTYEKITKRGTPGPGVDAEEHLQNSMRYSYDRYVARLRKLRTERPALVEFSEKYIDLFGVPFIGNGHRSIEGNEGLNFLDGAKDLGVPHSLRFGYTSAKQLPRENEQRFIDSIVSVEPLGMLPVHETEMIQGLKIGNMDFNGWGGYAEAFMFKFSDRLPMIGYLNRSFATTPLDGEGWLVFSAQRVKVLEKKVA